MTEIIHTIAKVLFVCAIIVGCFWLFKHHTRANIEQGDKSMDASLFPEGGYGVDTTIETIAGIKSGDFVAYRIPADPATVRIARVIGTEGSRVEVTAKEVLVNGTPLPGVRVQNTPWTIPETKIPRGCAYVLADDPSAGLDSKQIGPVPFSLIVGTVKPSR